jgi:predicted ABC-type ATPase
MWIVAGPNGSGKTTLVRAGFIQAAMGEPLESLNPDDIAVTIRIAESGIDPAEANLRAARISDSRVDQCIEEGRSFLAETVLSSDKFKDRVVSARSAGFALGLTFVVVESVEISIGRVAQRAQQGGHAVPVEKIRERWHKSLANFTWFARHADIVHVFDNTLVADPRLVAEKRGGRWHLFMPGRIPEVDAASREI